jgi:hypothetical protein
VPSQFVVGRQNPIQSVRPSVPLASYATWNPPEAALWNLEVNLS